MEIILFDDHALFASSLQRICLENEEIQSFDLVNSVKELEDRLSILPEAILLLDINLNKLGIYDSFALASNLMSENPQIKLAFLSGYDKPMYRNKANAMGVKGFFSKDISIEELIAGLKIINNGGSIYRKQNRIPEEGCSPTETQILAMAAKGMNRDEIADYLCVSRRTVGTHLTNIFQKLDVKNITEAVSVALDKGHIPPLF